jgi:hypothetical protein
MENTGEDADLLLRALRRGGYEVTCDVAETPAAMCAAPSDLRAPRRPVQPSIVPGGASGATPLECMLARAIPP